MAVNLLDKIILLTLSTFVIIIYFELFKMFFLDIFGKRTIYGEESDDSLINLGYERAKINSKHIKIAAYHEAGHAIAFLAQNMGIERIKVIEVDEYITNESHGRFIIGSRLVSEPECFNSYIKKEVTMSLAGRASEQVFFGIDIGGSGVDIASAKSSIKELIESGASDISFSCYNFEERNKFEKEFIDDAIKQATEIIKLNKEDVEKLAKELIMNKKLTATDIQKIVNIDSLKLPSDKTNVKNNKKEAI